MTVNNIYILGAALIGDRENDDRDEATLRSRYMNILLQEALNCENSMRVRDGQEQLPAAPIVTSTDDEIPYHAELVRAAFPYGLAWQYHQDAGDLGLSAQYRNMFVAAVNANYCYQVRRGK